MADKEVVLMFERMPFLRTCNLFDGRYFIWKTDQCRLFTCVTCIDVRLFADTEKYTSRSGMSICVKTEGNTKSG